MSATQFLSLEPLGVDGALSGSAFRYISVLPHFSFTERNIPQQTYQNENTALHAGGYRCGRLCSNLAIVFYVFLDCLHKETPTSGSEIFLGLFLKKIQKHYDLNFPGHDLLAAYADPKVSPWAFSSRAFAELNTVGIYRSQLFSVLCPSSPYPGSFP